MNMQQMISERKGLIYYRTKSVNHFIPSPRATLKYVTKFHMNCLFLICIH
jgi:hypothetical protein